MAAYLEHPSPPSSDSDYDSDRSISPPLSPLIPPPSLPDPFSNPRPTHNSSISPIEPLQLLVMGSGASAAVPDISCTTSPGKGCEGCLATLRPGGEKNVRGNTGVALRIPQKDGSEKCVLIDCGKTFREQAMKFFPKKGLRRIDAVVLTHLHADAIDGLDDLRAWTRKSAIEGTIPIYCTQTTYDCIALGFPYMVNKKAASGSGDVPSFDWHIFKDTDVLQIAGIRIVPLPAHHGIYFNKPGRPPLICCGFLIDSSIFYMSDVSYIPPEAWAIIEREIHVPAPVGTSVEREILQGVATLPRLLALIIDCTALRGNSSHIGLPQAMELAHRLGAQKTYLTDIPHATSHECWVHICEQISRGRTAKRGLRGLEDKVTRFIRAPKEHPEFDEQRPRDQVYEGLDPRAEDFEAFAQRALEEIETWNGGVLPPKWVRPLADGMTISWTIETDKDDAKVWDDEYR